VVVGGLLGTVVGITFAAVVTAVRPLPDVQLAVVESVVFLILAVIVGTLGAVGPARHGARIDVLEARHQN
jgi:ABC-type antimicrobial peptide transport system permease subunit